MRLALPLLAAIACTPPVPPAASPRTAAGSPPAAAPASLAGPAPSRPAPPPCPETEPDTRTCDAATRADAESRLRALEERIDGLAPGADPATANAALCEVLAHPCLALARRLGAPPPADSERALTSFWESGGREWLWQFLRLPSGEPVHLMVPPTMRPTLSRERAPDHRLAHLFCPETDATCGTETAGWLARADAAYDRFSAGHVRAPLTEDTPEDPETQCAAMAREAAPGARLEIWYQCVARIARRDALPVGSFRSPTEGWFVMRGRRGHYQFCDELGAYHLGTGAAYVARSCSGLALAPGGAVDHVATDDGRILQVVIGRVSVDNLREAVLLTLLSTVVVEGAIVRGQHYRIPDDVSLEVDELRGVTTAGFGGWSSSSAHTTLSWLYARDPAADTIIDGTLTWPTDPNSAAHDHAVELLRIAEASLTPGCAPAQLPADLPIATDARGVSRIDADPARLRDVNQRLVRALRGAKAARCR